MAEHTPGPWEAVENGGRLATDVFAGDLQIADCDWPQGELDGVTLESNARLIAAAPSLLAALKEVLAHVEDMDAPRVGNQCTLCHTYREIVRAAIARAESTS